MSNLIWSGETVFAATSGQSNLVTIRVPHRGAIKGYSLTQTSGANAGVTAALYSSKQDIAPNNALPAEAFHLLDITIPASSSKFDDHTTEIAYVNRDGTPTNPQRYLYLRITPAGTGEKNFVFSVTVDTARVG